MLYCPIFRVGTTEIIYHDGDVNCVHEIVGFMAVCGCWHIELSCIVERVKWLIWCLVGKGSRVCRYWCNTVEGAWLTAATRCMVVKGKLSW
jgi:hypothetical protein